MPPPITTIQEMLASATVVATDTAATSTAPSTTTVQARSCSHQAAVSTSRSTGLTARAVVGGRIPSIDEMTGPCPAGATADTSVVTSSEQLICLFPDGGRNLSIQLWFGTTWQPGNSSAL